MPKLDRYKKLDWSLFRSFLAVIDAGSLWGASKRLGTNQPTLSRQIYELESQLDVTLFEHTGRGLVPTKAALSMVDAARHMTSAAQDTVSSLRNSANEDWRTVRISASEVICTYLLPGCIAQLCGEFSRL
ncbi:LysR family transcriptional regulator [Undibacterium sp. TJN19]|uniref:LysR family transcriptional regulator n=1 Tax=Undibacterium sp. TJN19 TaxID=3413055 RepID=UPI003BF1FF3A